MNCRHGRQSEKGRGTLYTVCGRERLTFSKLAEFITPPDRFTLPYGFFIPVSPPRSLLQDISLTYNEILLSWLTFLSVRIF